MRGTMKVKIIFLILLSLALFMYAGCSQMSLFNLVEAEQEGEFSLGFESMNLKAGTEFNFSAVGGFLPYTYAVDEGADTGAIDPETGIYAAPGIESEATVEGYDDIGHRDSARVFIFEAITADPASFSLRLGDPDHPDQEISLTGGAGPFTAVAEDENAEVNPESFSTTPYTVTYSPPNEPGTDYIDITDEQENSLTIRVEVLPAAGDVDLEILPTYAVVAPGDSQTFNITNNTGNSLSIALSDSFGSIDNNTVAAGEISANVEYDAPSDVGAVFLTVEDDDTGEFVESDIYVQAEETTLEISPGNIKVSPGTKVEFTASGGVPPYVFSQVNGTGTLAQTSPTTANYTPESVISMIRVTDGVGNQAKVKIQVK